MSQVPIVTDNPASPALKKAWAFANTLDDSEIRRRILFQAPRRDVLFPASRIMADVFTSALPSKILRRPVRDVHVWNLAPGKATLSSWCRMPNHEHLDVVPTKKLVEALGNSLIISDRYAFYFEVVRHNGGTSTIYVQCDTIIASRIVAVVHSASIPGLHD